jgi:hypothetical protein
MKKILIKVDKKNIEEIGTGSCSPTEVSNQEGFWILPKKYFQPKYLARVPITNIIYVHENN